jgi:hypothetical protein
LYDRCKEDLFGEEADTDLSKNLHVFSDAPAIAETLANGMPQYQGQETPQGKLKTTQPTKEHQDQAATLKLKKNFRQNFKGKRHMFPPRRSSIRLKNFHSRIASVGRYILR